MKNLIGTNPELLVTENMAEEMFDMSMTASEAWEEIANGPNSVLEYWIDAYLKHAMDEDRNGWYVYRKRWRGYVRHRKNPYYDVVRLFYWKNHSARVIYLMGCQAEEDEKQQCVSEKRISKLEKKLGEARAYITRLEKKCSSKVD